MLIAYIFCLVVFGASAGFLLGAVFVGPRQYQRGLRHGARRAQRVEQSPGYRVVS